MSRRSLVLAVIVLALAAAGLWQQWRAWNAPQEVVLRGETMGTLFHVRAVAAGLHPQRDEPALREAVEARLRAVNGSMSTYDPQSELSRLNAAPANKPVPVSPALRTVLAAALALSDATGGAFDPTVGPLVNLWGFGPPKANGTPSDAAIRAAQARVGWHHVRLDAAGLTKLQPGIDVDLSAIAKGYGVDAVAKELEARGITDYLVEIGGDLRVRGHNAEGRPWAIGIEQPEEGLPQGEVLQAVVRLTTGGLATSGSYRRFRKVRQGISHHIIDPRTGRPTATPLVSVSVLAPDCMTADGIATALMVLGVDAGLRWVENRPDVEALFLTAAPDDTFVRHASSGFPPLEPPR